MAKAKVTRAKQTVAAEDAGYNPTRPRRDWSNSGSEPGGGANSKFVDRIRASAKQGWSDNSAEDRLAIDKDLLADLEREGIKLQWLTESVFGREERHHLSKFHRNGWQRVNPGDIEGLNVTEVEGLVLHARPLELHKKSQEHDRRLARDQVARKEHAWRGGDLPGVTLSPMHESALRSNRVNRSYERLAVPEE
jgi:hypothetical protein